jgi:hypothetical protein
MAEPGRPCVFLRERRILGQVHAVTTQHDQAVDAPAPQRLQGATKKLIEDLPHAASAPTACLTRPCWRKKLRASLLGKRSNAMGTGKSVVVEKEGMPQLDPEDRLNTTTGRIYDF